MSTYTDEPDPADDVPVDPGTAGASEHAPAGSPAPSSDDDIDTAGDSYADGAVAEETMPTPIAPRGSEG
jgi:hypothetical protein